MTDRGVSVTLDYILMLLIATILLGGVVAVAGSMIDGQVDRGTENELTIIGETLASDIQDVEQLMNASPNATLEVDVELPSHASGEAYVIEVVDDGTAIELSPDRSEQTVSIPVDVDRLDESEASIKGGSVVIRGDDGTIEVIPA